MRFLASNQASYVTPDPQSQLKSMANISRVAHLEVNFLLPSIAPIFGEPETTATCRVFDGFNQLRQCVKPTTAKRIIVTNEYGCDYGTCTCLLHSHGTFRLARHGRWRFCLLEFECRAKTPGRALTPGELSPVLRRRLAQDGPTAGGLP